jgi:hypothetical protein
MDPRANSFLHNADSDMMTDVVDSPTLLYCAFKFDAYPQNSPLQMQRTEINRKNNTYIYIYIYIGSERRFWPPRNLKLQAISHELPSNCQVDNEKSAVSKFTPNTGEL